MSDDMFPEVLAYLVGGPADEKEVTVNSSWPTIEWAEMIPITPRSLTEAELFPTTPSIRIHVYKPCPETGEWLWQGVR